MSQPAATVPHVFHPWGILRKLAHIRLSWVVMPDQVPGRTNGVDIIWMDKRLDQVERRCTLTHELIHIEQQHVGCQPEAIEEWVRAEAARRLIPIEDLATALTWSTSPLEVADDLWVTPSVLTDRLATLSTSDAATLAAVEYQTY